MAVIVRRENRGSYVVCQLLVPDAQARRKAEARIQRASAHMALEKQSLPSAQTKQRIEELADELVHDIPPDFWEVK